MENNAELAKYTVYSAQTKLEEDWGLHLKVPTFLEWANDAARKIGYNKNYVKIGITVLDNGVVPLPFKAINIKAVSTDYNDFYSWEVLNADILNEDGIPNAIDRFGIAAKELSLNPNQLKGGHVNYTFENETELIVNSLLKDRKVYVLALVKMVDEDNEPLFTEKQLEAISTYCAYIYTKRNAFAGIKGMDLAFMKSESDKAIASARIPDFISDNAWDLILDAKTSFNRKSFNKSFQ